KFNRDTSEWEDGEPLFLRCSLWRQAAENVAESLSKGTRVIVQGRLVQRSYETSEGEKRTVMELQVDEIGPSLRYATAKVNKAGRSSSGNSAGDPWGSPPPVGGPMQDEPPFCVSNQQQPEKSDQRSDPAWRDAFRLMCGRRTGVTSSRRRAAKTRISTTTCRSSQRTSSSRGLSTSTTNSGPVDRPSSTAAPYVGCSVGVRGPTGPTKQSPVGAPYRQAPRARRSCDHRPARPAGSSRARVAPRGHALDTPRRGRPSPTVRP